MTSALQTRFKILHIWMVIVMLVSESLSTDALKSSASVLCHAHCQAYVAVVSNMFHKTYAVNKILSSPEPSEILFVLWRLHWRQRLQFSFLNPWNEYISHIFFFYHESDCIWSDFFTVGLSNHITFFSSWSYCFWTDVILSDIHLL